MRFTKMQGLGNDYIYVYDEVPVNVCEIAKQLSDRHFGIGSDGFIYIFSSKIADFKMRIFNADGSEAKMCGNGIRCVGKYVYEKGYTNKTKITIETLSGIKELYLNISNGKVIDVTVNMGKSIVYENKIFNVNGKTIDAIPVSVGNMHAVIFVEDINEIELNELGPKIEHHPAFKERVNVEFVQVLNDHELRMRVWEKGSGVTMACGTGACASVVASISKKICEFNNNIFVHLDGGTLEIQVNNDDEVFMNGPCEIVFEGETKLF